MSQASFLITGKGGLSLLFNGHLYANPDAAAIEEGKSLERNFKDIKVSKFLAGEVKVLYKSKTRKEERCERINRNIQKLFSQPRQVARA